MLSDLGGVLSALVVLVSVLRLLTRGPSLFWVGPTVIIIMRMRCRGGVPSGLWTISWLEELEAVTRTQVTMYMGSGREAVEISWPLRVHEERWRQIKVVICKVNIRSAQCWKNTARYCDDDCEGWKKKGCNQGHRQSQENISRMVWTCFTGQIGADAYIFVLN